MASRFDPMAPDKGMQVGRAVRGHSGPTLPPGEVDYLQLIGQAEDISRDDFARRVQRQIANAQRAWRNEHSHGSKYLDKAAFRGRSRLFVPKTRAGIRKNKAGAAAALFATNDVISITAEYDDDPVALASADVLGQIVNYRLSRTSHKAGLPWFPIAIAGRHAADIEGVTISKQFWEFHEEPTGEVEETFVLNEESGLYEPASIPIMDVKRDRPMIELIPYENVYVDPMAPWYDPAQLGAWFIARFPMHISDVRAMMEHKGKSGSRIPWREVSDEELRMGMTDDQRSQQRRARESGTDRMEGLMMPREWDIVWINENFMRYDGKEECWWSVGRHAMLSDPIPTEEAYPEQYGMRPYVWGVSEVEPHVLSPMPPVESWQPLQLEINDVVNLRLDATKRSIAPLAKVRRGRQVDYEQVKRRGQPEAMLVLNDPEKDVVFEATPGPNGQAYTEVAHANSMFDELSGSFSASSVQSNRQLNETVGGMKMLAGAGNATSEYDLRVWVETWVEPTLRQIINLVQHYESDEKVFALAGRKAQAWKRHGVNPTLDQLMEAEVQLRVNVGIGAQDPMQMLQKLGMAMEMLTPMFELMLKQGIVPNMETLIEEVFGRAGFKDGHRFFLWDQPPPEGGGDPEMAKVEAQKEFNQGKLQLEQQKAAGQMQLKQAEIAGNMQLKQQEVASNIMLKREEAKAKVSLAAQQAQMKTLADFRGQDIQASQADRQGDRDFQARRYEADQASENERLRIKADRDVGFAGADAKARSAGAKPGGGGRGSPGSGRSVAVEDGGQSALLTALVERLEEMGGQQQGPDEMQLRMMAMMAQMVDKLTDLAAAMAGPKKVVRDPQTGEITGVVPVEQGQIGRMR